MGFFFGDGPTSACAKQPQGPIHCSWAPRTSKLQAPRPTLDRISIFAASRLPRRRPQTRYPYPPCRYRSPTVKRRMATRARQRPSSSYVAVLPPPPPSLRRPRLDKTIAICQGRLVVDSSDPRSEAPREAPASGPSPSTSPRLVAPLSPSSLRLSVSPAPANGSELDSPSSMSPATPSSGTP